MPDEGYSVAEASVSPARFSYVGLLLRTDWKKRRKGRLKIPLPLFLPWSHTPSPVDMPFSSVVFSENREFRAREQAESVCPDGGGEACLSLLAVHPV